MDLDRLRRDLMAQHAEVRRLLAEAEGAAQALLDGRSERSTADLRELLERLQSLFDHHSAQEQAVLAPILRRVDPAWGPERVEIMEREHAREHEALLEATAAAAAATTLLDLVATTGSLARELRAHMQEEERYLLDRDVLTDNPVRTRQMTD
jgi:iron-sulfur cluster repair protein YtfE (RIC family)